jgi:hypothetical protein
MEGVLTNLQGDIQRIKVKDLLTGSFLPKIYDNQVKKLFANAVASFLSRMRQFVW